MVGAAGTTGGGGGGWSAGGAVAGGRSVGSAKASTLSRKTLPATQRFANNSSRVRFWTLVSWPCSEVTVFADSSWTCGAAHRHEDWVEEVDELTRGRHGAHDGEERAFDGRGGSAGLDLEGPGLGDLGRAVPGGTDGERPLRLADALLTR